MKPPESRSFPARAEALGEVFAFIEKWSADCALPQDPMLRLRLVAEELFLNVSLHGYAGAPGEVLVSLTDLGGEVELALEDGAVAFNPFKTLPLVSCSANPYERPVGKLGILMVVQFSTRRSYQRIAGRNCMRVALRKAP